LIKLFNHIYTIKQTMVIEKKKCIRITTGPMAGVVVRRYKTECDLLVKMGAAVYVSKGTMKSFLNQYKKTARTMKLAADLGITDWNDLPSHVVIATYGNGVTSMYVVPKGMDALLSLQKGYTTNTEHQALIAAAETVLKTNEDPNKSTQLKAELKALTASRINSGTHYFIEKQRKNKSNAKLKVNDDSNSIVLESDLILAVNGERADNNSGE